MEGKSTEKQQQRGIKDSGGYLGNMQDRREVNKWLAVCLLEYGSAIQAGGGCKTGLEAASKTSVQAQRR